MRVVVTPPGGAPPVADVPAILAHVNGVAPAGKAGTQHTGAIICLRRIEYPARPAAGTRIATAARAYDVQRAERTAAWWRCEVTRVP